MRILTRDKSLFTYKIYTGKTEVMVGGKHTGEFTETYGAEQIGFEYVSTDRGVAKTDRQGIKDNSRITIICEKDLGIGRDSIITWAGKDFRVESLRKSFHHVQITAVEI